MSNVEKEFEDKTKLKPKKDINNTNILNFFKAKTSDEIKQEKEINSLVGPINIVNPQKKTDITNFFKKGQPKVN